MKAINNIGLIAMAIWLVGQGMVTLFQVKNPTIMLVLPILAIVAGVLILLRIRDSKPMVSLGFLLLSVWLILGGVMPLMNVQSVELAMVMAALGLAAGVLMLVSQ